ncbi:uncharacterized protein LOC129706229 isoform X2 [Leucoraja erinacea]|uniref:uncharacterized protein LOC129706229 isoform X2 n=1 Tax=Leucoraja erinaceus TaxID=7782 RepID=UPI00245780E0|nr:uncharacterized protein LOC129706229 isoform X2 [Leucoraja erinacea]
MATSCHKPNVLVFNSDIAHQWGVFRRDFQHYVTIAHPAATDEMRASLLLNLAGPDALERSESFVYGVGEDARDPVCLMAKSTAMCDIPTNCILERFKMFSRRQIPGESIDNYIAALRHMARRCRLDALTPDQVTRDILVYGLLDVKLRAELLRKPDLSLDEALHASRMAEAVASALSPADHDINFASAAGRRRNAGPPRQRGSPAPGGGSTRRCPNCNFASHQFNICPALGKTCNFCRKLNHFSAACRSRVKPVPPPRRMLNNLAQADSEFGSQHQLDELPLSDTSSSQGETSIFSLLDAHALITDPSVRVTVNGSTFSAKLDKGAVTNVMSTSLSKKIRADEIVTVDNSRLHAYGGGVLVPVGKATLHCKVLKASRPLTFYLLDSDDVTLLGAQACQDLDLVSFHRDIHQVRTLMDPLWEYPDRFDDKLGKLPSCYKIAVDPSVDPVIRPSHRVTFAMKDKVESTLLNMITMGILKEGPEDLTRKSIP